MREHRSDLVRGTIGRGRDDAIDGPIRIQKGARGRVEMKREAVSGHDRHFRFGCDNRTSRWPDGVKVIFSRAKSCEKALRYTISVS